MITTRFTLIDVFAQQPLEGNLLAVIEDADEIDDGTMAVLARRFRLSETSFIQTATSDTATYRHRIFVVDGEIPFAGHPSLGTAAVWAHRHGLATADFVQQTISGEQRLHVEMNGRSGSAAIWQNPAEFGEVVDATPLVEVFGLDAGAAHPDLKAQVMSTGLPTLVLPLRDAEDLTRLRIDSNRLSAAMPVLQDGSIPLTCYVVAEVGSGAWKARSFGADIAGGEDPATGSAAGPFGAYLKKHTGLTTLTIAQGIEMGCPSQLDVDVTDGIVVSGRVQIMGEGELQLP